MAFTPKHKTYCGLRRTKPAKMKYKNVLIFGAGMGPAFVASQIATLAGVAEEDSGLASGIEETSLAIGGAFGIAILATVIISRTEFILAGSGIEAYQLSLQTEAFQFAFSVGAAFASFELLAAL